MELTPKDIKEIENGNFDGIFTSSSSKSNIWYLSREEASKIMPAIVKGVKKSIEKLAQGKNLIYVIEEFFDHRFYGKHLQELKSEYEKALYEYKKIEIERVTEKLRKDEITPEEYDNNKWKWEKYAEEIKRDNFKLWQDFEIALNEYRMRHNIDRKERVKELAPYGEWGPYIDLETGKITLLPYAHGDIKVIREVIEEFRKKYGINIELDYNLSYWPEDMSEGEPPLKKGFWYFKIEITEDRFDETLKIFREMEGEIKRKIANKKEQKELQKIKQGIIKLIEEDKEVINLLKVVLEK